MYDQLEKLIQQRGLSKSALAKLAGLHPDTVVSAFWRKSGMSLEVAMKLADALDVSLDWIAKQSNIKPDDITAAYTTALQRINECTTFNRTETRDVLRSQLYASEIVLLADANNAIDERIHSNKE